MRFRSLFPLIVFFALTGVTACGGASDQPKANAAEDATKSGETNSTSALDTQRAREGALGDMSLGNPDAAVTLVEFASFTCAHCSSFHTNFFPSIKEKFIDTGKINFVFRELPTSPQQLSYIGSVIARCVADKGGDEAFFAVADGLFHKQREWVWAKIQNWSCSRSPIRPA